MADPSIQTFCCRRDGEYSRSVDFLSEFNSDSYNTVCLASSTIGILGAIYQILPRETAVLSQRWYAVSTTRGRKIVIWLAVADLLASLGVFLRSVFWLNFTRFAFTSDPQVVIVICAVSSAWIQYFYTATWLWTMVYAIDMRQVFRERCGHPKSYHAAVWSIPAVLTACGLAVLYLPNADCHDIHSMSTAALRILPNYFASYVPMAAVMIINPLLYGSLSNDVEVMVARSCAQFTDKERHIVDMIRVKFLMINIAFYACWMPNLINGVIIWSLWFNLPQKVIITLWYIMALMNPLQALFNSLVYRRWSRGAERVVLPCRNNMTDITPVTNISNATSKPPSAPNESTPLMSSINCSSNSDNDDEDNHNL